MFGQLKRIAKQWLDNYLICKGGTYPAQLKYKMLADIASNRITAAITRQFLGDRPIRALLDPYNHTGSTRHVRFNTSRSNRWEASGPPPKNHVNWVVLDSDWESEFCRVAESHPKVIAYTKNHNLGLDVPYRYGSETRKYLPDFIVLVNDGHGPDDPLHLLVEIKGYRREDAKEKKISALMAAGPSLSSQISGRSAPSSRLRSKASSTRCFAAELLDVEGLRIVKYLPGNGEASSEAAE